MKQALFVIGKILGSILLLILIIVFELLFLIFEALAPVFDIIFRFFYILYGFGLIVYLIFLLLSFGGILSEHRLFFSTGFIVCSITAVFFHLSSKLIIDTPTVTLFKFKERLKERLKRVWNI